MAQVKTEVRKKMYNQDAAEALKGDKGGGEMGRRGKKSETETSKSGGSGRVGGGGDVERKGGGGGIWNRNHIA
jgi:hypothetical protein